MTRRKLTAREIAFLDRIDDLRNLAIQLAAEIERLELDILNMEAL